MEYVLWNMPSSMIDTMPICDRNIHKHFFEGINKNVPAIINTWERVCACLCACASTCVGVIAWYGTHFNIVEMSTKMLPRRMDIQLGNWWLHNWHWPITEWQFDGAYECYSNICPTGVLIDILWQQLVNCSKCRAMGKRVNFCHRTISWARWEKYKCRPHKVCIE